jgi:hypothetical protein
MHEYQFSNHATLHCYFNQSKILKASNSFVDFIFNMTESGSMLEERVLSKGSIVEFHYNHACLVQCLIDFHFCGSSFRRVKPSYKSSKIEFGKILNSLAKML